MEEESSGKLDHTGMQAAYDSLDQAMREQLDGFEARHESAHVFAPSEEIRLAEAVERKDPSFAEWATA